MRGSGSKWGVANAKKIGRETAQAVAASLTLGLLLLIHPGPVLAECDGPAPSFQEVAPTAAQVVIGEVVSVRPGGVWDPSRADGLSSRFTVRVTETLRGSAASTLKIDDVLGQPCSSAIGAHLGDRVVIALDGRAFTPPVAANAIVWLAGTPMPGGARMTLDAVRAAVSGQPDTSSPRPVPDSTWAPSPAILSLAGVLGLLLGRRSLRRSARPPRQDSSRT